MTRCKFGDCKRRIQEMRYGEYRHALIWEGALEDEPKLEKNAINRLFNDTDAWMIRNVYDFDCGIDTSFWYIIKDSYTSEEYTKKVRKYIDKANAKFDIRLISKSRMLRQGYDVYAAAHTNYKIDDGFQYTRQQFIDELESMNEEYEFWGCIDRDTDLLQAYSICHIHDGMCWFKYSRANPDFLPKYYPMYGLYDARHKYYLKEVGLKYLLTSARSITEHSHIQEFLIEKFGYRKAFCHLRMYYRPWLKLIINMIYPFRNLIKYRPVRNLLVLENFCRIDIKSNYSNMLNVSNLNKGG